MSVARFLQHLHLSYFSKPAADRPVYRAVRQLRPKRIVELGVGRGERSQRMLKMALQLVEGNLHYTGADLFEGRGEDREGLSLKEAHRLLAGPRVTTRLAPGDVLSVLSRSANSLGNTDLLLIAAGHEPSVLEAAWYYVPRMLHERSIVMRQSNSEGDEPSAFEVVARVEVERLAAAACPGIRSAA